MKNNDHSKPLIGQIYDELFANIEKHNEFDAETIKKLKKDGLKKLGKVMGAIKVTVEEKKDETNRTGN